MDKAINKGYLQENFRLFHLRDRLAPRVEPHYHEFDKVVVLYAGAVDYTVEGVSYRMQPGDVLFVRHHDIHCPVIDPNSDYERAVLWIAPEFLDRLDREETPDASGEEEPGLRLCFDRTSELRSCHYRPCHERFSRIRRLLQELERAIGSEDFGADLMRDACIALLMVELNRMVLSTAVAEDRSTDDQIEEVLRHIHLHLSDDLSVDTLASRCYLSRYYFMRRFKESTGYSVHAYIQQKRLTTAASLLEQGLGITEAAVRVGFREYSSFLRAFRKAFGMTPGEYARTAPQLQSEYSE
ncbi:MAG: helix-turn-helix domain-containing protein [Oscillospiraceae bacterium]|nr:helix-turn-helix domain-containing protein [Oscillospiraceae bacterium]